MLLHCSTVPEGLGSEALECGVGYEVQLARVGRQDAGGGGHVDRVAGVRMAGVLVAEWQKCAHHRVR